MIILNKKLLILGNKGMQGHMSELYFSNHPDYYVKGLNRKDIDVTNLSRTLETITNCNPDIILNCTGILNNDDDLQKYAKVNIVFPQVMADYCLEKNKKFIQISTNCVFEDFGPHEETETPNAKDLYGLSKAMGEINDYHNLTIRTSIIGPELKQNGIGLMHKYITDDNFTKGYSNVMWNGVTTLELSKYIDKCIKEDKTGLVNYYTYNETSKSDLLNIINNEFKVRDITPIENNKQHQSLLTGIHYTNTPYTEQVKDLKNITNENKHLYDKRYNK
jgi:dTDP-4-dehydrorhamnose reductase